MEKGAVVQVWRGAFLDATPRWHERGDGSSRPAGSITSLGKPAFFLQKLATSQDPWPADSIGTGYKPKGYRLSKDDRPAFRYIIYGTEVTDALTVLENGQGIKREITLLSPVQNIYALLASGNKIELLPGGQYLVGDKEYYIQVDDNGGAQPMIRTSGTQQQLLLPVKGKIIYTILY
jgi:hypothetical protein